MQFTVFVCVLFVLPTGHPVTAINMNYAVVAIGGVIVAVAINWIWWGHARFVGPVRTLDEDVYEEKETS